MRACFKLDKTKKMCKCLCKIEWWGVVFGACGRIWLRFTAGQTLFWHFATLAHNTGTNHSVRVKVLHFMSKTGKKVGREEKQSVGWIRYGKQWDNAMIHIDFVAGWRIRLEPCAPMNIHNVSNHQPNFTGTECFPNTTLPKTHTISSLANACWRCCRWVT